MIRRIALLAVLAAASAAGAAAGSTSSAAGCPAASRWLVHWDSTIAGRVVRPATLYRRPGRGVVGTLGVADRYGFPTTVSVLERRTLCSSRWYRVRYTTWPNGASAWVRSGDLVTTRLRSRIVVDVSRRRLFLFRRGRVVLSTPAAVGKGATPTPIGWFFITQKFVVDPATGPYGPRAIGISAFSNILRSWRDGGPIGIHGTNERFSVGKPVSHGCVRLPNAAIMKLFAVVPLGTPVVIRR
ncbi:MAG TPA: L,D-transpeptidase [Gaiellaceae bacterium]